MATLLDDHAAVAADPVRRIVLGGRFGEEPQTLSWQRLDRFVAAGGCLVETAHCYADGRAEATIGAWMTANPGRVKLIDKVGHPDEHGRLDLSVAALEREAALSCERLGIDRIDVLLLHRDDARRGVDELAAAMLELTQRGYAHRVGVSNWAASRVAALADALKGHDLVASYQRSLAVPAAPLWPGTLHADEAVMQALRMHGIPLLAWAAQARGFFAGCTELPRPDGDDPFDNLDNRQRRDRCATLAKEGGVRPETIALAWLLHQPQTYAIIGPRSLAELNISIDAAQVQLSDSELRWLSMGEDG